jgi:hypothetical protein
MKIEYIPDSSKDCPLILIHGPNVNAIISLRQACLNLANGKAEFFLVHDLPGIEREASCKLLAYAGRRDLGVLRMPEPDSFRWELTATSWLNVEGLLEPFCRVKSKHRHQYLDDSSGMPVNISTDRSW